MPDLEVLKPKKMRDELIQRAKEIIKAIKP